MGLFTTWVLQKGFWFSFASSFPGLCLARQLLITEGKSVEPVQNRASNAPSLWGISQNHLFIEVPGNIHDYNTLIAFKQKKCSQDFAALVV